MKNKYLNILEELDNQKLYKTADKLENIIRTSQLMDSPFSFYQEDKGSAQGIGYQPNKYVGDMFNLTGAMGNFYGEGMLGPGSDYKEDRPGGFEGPFVFETPSPTQEAQMTPQQLYDLKIRNLEGFQRYMAQTGEPFKAIEFYMTNLAKSGGNEEAKKNILQASIPTLTKMYSDQLRSQPSTQWRRIINDFTQKAAKYPGLSQYVPNILQNIFKEISREARNPNNTKLRQSLQQSGGNDIFQEYGVQPVS